MSAPGSRPPLVDVAVAVVVRADRVLVARRDPQAHLGGCWEFPGGKIRPDEPAAATALRELAEETGLRAGHAEPLVVFVHDYPDRACRFHCFVVRDAEGEVETDGARPWAWVTVDGLSELEMPPANVAIVRALRWRLGPPPTAG